MQNYYKGIDSMTSLHNIQILRAIAAILVVLHHFLPQFNVMGGNNTWVSFISTWGFTGVDIFFVISGFIMVYTSFDKAPGFDHAKTFLIHRFSRIFLGYWPFFVAMLLFLFLSNPTHLQKLDIFGSFVLLNANMYQLILPVSWSLSYELYFYMMFVLIFFFSIKKRYILVPIFIIFFIIYSQFSNTSFFNSYFLLEFFAGMLLAMYRQYLTSLWLLPFALILLGFSVWYGINHEYKNGIMRIISFGSSAFFLVQIALILEKKHIIFNTKILEHLGDSSYTLYLSHYIIIQCYYALGIRDIFTSPHSFVALIGLVVFMLLCIVFSLYYYTYIERPLYKKVISYF